MAYLQLQRCPLQASLAYACICVTQALQSESQLALDATLNIFRHAQLAAELHRGCRDVDLLPCTLSLTESEADGTAETS